MRKWELENKYSINVFHSLCQVVLMIDKSTGVDKEDQ